MGWAERGGGEVAGGRRARRRAPSPRKEAALRQDPAGSQCGDQL